ncbi:hypothetical protein Tco_1555271 [Tanacetum coccineum]
MMTTEYCPGTEIQKMEQELWTLTLKRDDIEGYNNRFHELALMCPDLVTPERKKIERLRPPGLVKSIRESGRITRRTTTTATSTLTITNTMGDKKLL